MRLSQQAFDRSLKSNLKSSRRARASAVASVIDTLEKRQLFSGETVSSAISPILSTTGTTVTLNQHFTDDKIPGTLATFSTTLGTITVALTDAATPLTVANFLNYINSGAYTDTIFHRDALLSSGSGGGSPSKPADIIQGGGYVLQGTSLNHIPTNAPVNDEYLTRSFGNLAGTLAMAKTSAANSATSEFYFNVHDESSALDTPTASGSGQTSYTVFGKVITGINVVNSIAALPTYNYSSSLNTVPVVGLSEAKAKKEFPITANNLVYTNSITAVPGTNYTVTSSNNALVTPNVKDGVLSFTYASGLSGTAEINVLAKNLDGTSASTSFTVTVPNTATPTAGPVAGNVTAPNTTTGTTSDFSVLGKATDSVAALDPGKVTIVTQPAHGTATVDTTTGHIKYTPTAGYTGADSLTFTVADTAGTVSAAATASLNVVTAPVAVTIGTAAVKSLSFTQPDGVIGKLTIKGGTAVVTFASSDVTTSTSKGVITATGTGATIASIVITDKGTSADLTLSASGAVSIGSITDNKAVGIINAPTATLTGALSVSKIGRLILAGATDAILSLGSGTSTNLQIDSLTNTTATSTGKIASITSKQWLISDGGFYAITAPSIGKLNVSGTFSDVLNLTSTGSALSSSIVGQATAAWSIAGTVGRVTLGTPVSTFSLNASSGINSLTINGNLANTITAPSIGSLKVTGTTTSATITTTDSSKAINVASFGGAVATSSLTAAGTISKLTAASLTSTQITATTLGNVKVSGDTNSATIKSTQTALSGQQIGQIRIGGAFNSSSVTAVGSVGTVLFGSITSSQLTATSLGSLTVAGNTTGATVSTTGTFSAKKIQIGKLRFAGAVGTSTVSAIGNIGRVLAGSLTASQIYAGVGTTIVQDTKLPTVITDYSANARIASVTLGKGATAFSNSLISSETMGKLKLGNINTANSAAAEGIAVHTIQSVQGNLVPGGTLNAKPKDLKSAAAFAKYTTAKKLTLGDFVIKII